MAELTRAIGARMEQVLISWDCADASSRPTSAGPEAEQRAVRSLRDDLASGRWAERNCDLVALDAAELGLRLFVT
jgi:hypothetical protein